MDLLNKLPDQLHYGVIVLLVCWGVTLWRNWKKAKTEFKNIQYKPNFEEESDSWRWSHPPDEIGLAVQDNNDSSWLQLTPDRSLNEIVFGFLGGVLATLTLYITIISIINMIDGTAIYPFGFALLYICVIGFLAYALCCVDAPIIAIARNRDNLIFKVRRAGFLSRTITYRQSKVKDMRFTGKVQGFLEMNTDQLNRLPDFKLTVQRRFRTSSRFLMRCNPTQGNWIVAGLNQWQDVMAKSL